MALSIFADKEPQPQINDLKPVLGKMLGSWEEILGYIYSKYPEAVEQWSFAGKKYGWSFSLRDKKRAIVYLTPSSSYFMVGMVFGQKATAQALSTGISEEIKDIIRSAKVYAEGRGFRLDLKDNHLIGDIKRLIDIKLAN